MFLLIVVCRHFGDGRSDVDGALVAEMGLGCGLGRFLVLVTRRE